MTSEAFLTKEFFSTLGTVNEPVSLSMFISESSFMYAIFSSDFRHIRELCHVQMTQLASSAYDVTEQVTFLVHNYLLHQKKFEHVNITVLNSDFTIVPQAYAADSHIRSLLGFSTGKEQVKRVLQHSIKYMKFYFTIDPGMLAFLEKTFANASFRHAGAVNISLFFSQHSLAANDLYLQISDGFIELTAKREKELLFYNVFNYAANEDILYYLLFTMEQFDLSPLAVRLVVSAERPVTDDLIKNIRKYVRQVSFSVPDPSIELNKELVALPQHYYFTLLNQHLCEL